MEAVKYFEKFLASQRGVMIEYLLWGIDKYPCMFYEANNEDIF